MDKTKLIVVFRIFANDPINLYFIGSLTLLKALGRLQIVSALCYSLAFRAICRFLPPERMK
jgi:hypothetical protein